MFTYYYFFHLLADVMYYMTYGGMGFVTLCWQNPITFVAVYTVCVVGFVVQAVRLCMWAMKRCDRERIKSKKK